MLNKECCKQNLSPAISESLKRHVNLECILRGKQNSLLFKKTYYNVSSMPREDALNVTLNGLELIQLLQSLAPTVDGSE